MLQFVIYILQAVWFTFFAQQNLWIMHNETFRLVTGWFVANLGYIGDKKVFYCFENQEKPEKIEPDTYRKSQYAIILDNWLRIRGKSDF